MRITRLPGENNELSDRAVRVMAATGAMGFRKPSTEPAPVLEVETEDVASPEPLADAQTPAQVSVVETSVVSRPTATAPAHKSLREYSIKELMAEIVSRAARHTLELLIDMGAGYFKIKLQVLDFTAADGVVSFCFDSASVDLSVPNGAKAKILLNGKEYQVEFAMLVPSVGGTTWPRLLFTLQDPSQEPSD